MFQFLLLVAEKLPNYTWLAPSQKKLEGLLIISDVQLSDFALSKMKAPSLFLGQS